MTKKISDISLFKPIIDEVCDSIIDNDVVLPLYFDNKKRLNLIELLLKFYTNSEEFDKCVKLSKMSKDIAIEISGSKCNGNFRIQS